MEFESDPFAPTRSELLASALGYARRGWYLFPIRAPYKDRPLVKWSQHASRDGVTIERWWTQWPDANIGLDCGRTGIFVLDVDQHTTEANGVASLAALEMMHGVLPPTLMQRTPSGGTQYLFHGAFANSQSKLGPGLDTRGPGGMVLLPPSRTAKGHYTWLNNYAIAQAPEFLGEVLGSKERERVEQEPVADLDQPAEIRRYREWLRDNAPRSITGRGGGDVLVKIIVPVGKDHGLTRETVKEVLSEPGGYNETKCDPPWELSDDNVNGLFKKVDNGFDYCRENAPGCATAQAAFANCEDPPPSSGEIAKRKLRVSDRRRAGRRHRARQFM